MLEVIVRPSQSPDIRPPIAFGLQASPAPTPDTEVVWGSAGNNAFNFTRHVSQSIEAVHNETTRTFDKVRVKNPDDLSQHVDVEAMTKYQGKNAIDRSRITINYDRVQEADNIEVLSRDNTRNSTT